MRVLSGWLLAVPLAAGAGGVAIASPQFSSTFALTFSSATPGSPSGLDVSATWSDPGGANGVPKAVTKIEFVGPPGTKFDTSALPRCRASDEDIANLSVRACPRSSKIGSVKGEGLIVTGNPVQHRRDAVQRPPPDHRDRQARRRRQADHVLPR